MLTYQVKLDLADGSLGLPDWEGKGVPPVDFVVARRLDGSVASRYGDSSWDLTAYHAHGKALILRFKGDTAQVSDAEAALQEEVRWLIFLLMWCSPISLSVQTLSGYFYGYRALSRFALIAGVSIKEILSNAELLQQASAALLPSVLPRLNSTISFLHQLGPEVVGFEVVVGDALRRMQAIVREYQSNSKQHPPLPTRVYAHLLTALNREMEDFNRVAGEFFGVLAEHLRDYSPTPRIGIEVNIPHDVGTYLTRKALPHSAYGLCSALKYVQMYAKLQIQAYTGMRDQEAGTLPYHCVRVERIDNRDHSVIHGWSTKFNRGKRKAAKWVTAPQGVTAIGIAQRIADIVYDMLGISITQSSPLFVHLRYLPFDEQTKKYNGKSVAFASLTISGRQGAEWASILFPTIEPGDLQELEHIDPHRAWNAEPSFALGTRWPFTSHQLRRSLALYAQRSGLVSLPALKRQLQHITEEMSRYYARGSAFAEDFLKEQGDHVGRDWQEAAPVSAALSYMLNVLYSDEVLFGGHVQWVDRNLRNTDGTVLADREVTLKRFKKGELAYRETIMGGCTNPEGCKTAAINVLDIECVAGCMNMVGRLSNLERVITVQERFVASLPLGSVEHTTELNDLTVLHKAREMALNKQKEIA